MSNTDTDTNFIDWAPEIYNKEISDFLKEVYYVIEKHRDKGNPKTCLTAAKCDMSKAII